MKNLYKVSPPREDALFHPSPFWHTADWESSTDKPREGYIRDEVLYAGDFDEISIHLFPRVRVVRIRAIDISPDKMLNLGVEWDESKSTYIFVHASFKNQVEAFTPTIYSFKTDGFENIRRGEYISRFAQKSIASEIVSHTEIVSKWKIQIIFVDDLDLWIEKIRQTEIYFCEQR